MSPQRPKSTNKKEFRYLPVSKDLPATQGMLHLVRNELKFAMKSGFSQVDARFNHMEARFSTIDGRFNQMEAKFNGIDSKFSNVDAQFSEVNSKLERVLSEVSRIGVLVEEQHSKNRITLEGLSGLWHRQERIETRVDEVEEGLRSVARSRT